MQVNDSSLYRLSFFSLNLHKLTARYALVSKTNLKLMFISRSMIIEELRKKLQGLNSQMKAGQDGIEKGMKSTQDELRKDFAASHEEIKNKLIEEIKLRLEKLKLSITTN